MIWPLTLMTPKKVRNEKLDRDVARFVDMLHASIPYLERTGEDIRPTLKLIEKWKAFLEA